MYIKDSLNTKNYFMADHNIANKRSSVINQKDSSEMQNPVVRQSGLSVNSESYSLYISSEAKMMVEIGKENGQLIVNSEEDKEKLLSMLGKNKDKIVNQGMKKFCEDNGIDISQPIEKLESFIAIRTAEMDRKDAMYTDSSMIIANARCFVDAFNGGDFIGQYPPEAIYTMYEKRFKLYVRELTDYIDKYGRDPDLRKTIEYYLDQKNPDGTNEVANLVKEITDRIYSGKADTVDKLIKDKAKEAYEHTYDKEIADATEAERKRREKSINQMKKLDEQIEKQRESLQDQIKKLQDKIMEEEKNLALTGQSENGQIRMMKKQLEVLQQKLSGLPVGGGMPPASQDWSDMSVLVWNY